MMKKLIVLIAMQFVAVHAFCQAGSNDYTNAINNYTLSLYNIVHDNYKDSVVLRRIESGLLTLSSDGDLYAYTSRKLFSGNKYLIVAFTDSRVNDFTLGCYKETADGKSDLLGKVSSRTASSTKYISGYELYSFTVNDDGNYRFFITSNGKEKSGRFALMIFSFDTNSSSQTSSGSSTSSTSSTDDGPLVTYNIDYYQSAFYDSSTSKYGDWSKETTVTCSFELNKEQTIFLQRYPTGEVYKYYVQSKSESDNKLWMDYNVLNSDGKKLIFKLPLKSDNNYFRVLGVNSSNTPFMSDYHIKSN
jgi:hypothetical protein